MTNLESKAILIFERLGFLVKSYKDKTIIDPVNTIYSQYPFQNMRIDFVLPLSRLAIEIDGEYWHGTLNNRLKTHQVIAKINDNKKIALLKSQGWSILKVSSYMLNIDTINNCIYKLLKF